MLKLIKRMVKMRKESFIVITILLISIMTIIGIFGVDYIKEQNNKINNYKNDLNKIKKELENNNHEQNTTKTCEYTKTYRFIEYYNFKGNTPDNYFIIIDQFQKNEPIILALDTTNFEKNFKKDEDYEITFKSIKDINDNITTTITKIEQTNKEGLEQTQETCLFN